MCQREMLDVVMVINILSLTAQLGTNLMSRQAQNVYNKIEIQHFLLTRRVKMSYEKLLKMYFKST